MVCCCTSCVLKDKFTLIDSWKTNLLAFHDRRILSIFLFGFSSGLPFLLTLSTLTLWLKECGVNNKTVGLFVIATIPYTLKFLWGPLVDRLRLPLLSRVLGQRRSWALFSQSALMIMLGGLGLSDPQQNIFHTALWALGVAFFSAIQDIAVESYRIEISDENQQGTSASSSYLGYRLGMMASGVGALYLATLFSWQTAYMVMAALMGVGMMTTFFSHSPKESLLPQKAVTSQISLFSKLTEGLITTYGMPLKELLHTLDWRMVMALIIFYKIGDTTLNVMNIPFLVEIGFSKLEIANVAKFFGISAMIVGGLLGGLFLNRYGLFASLILCALLQLMTSFMFIMQSLIGYNLNVLIITIGLENLGCGLGAAAFIAYLSSLCRAPHTATHFALLSSFASLTRILLSVVAGFLADTLSWPLFFTCVACAALAFLLLLMYAAPHPYFRIKPAR